MLTTRYTAPGPNPWKVDVPSSGLLVRLDGLTQSSLYLGYRCSRGTKRALRDRGDPVPKYQEEALY
jgi:hypothetical protein